MAVSLRPESVASSLVQPGVQRAGGLLLARFICGVVWSWLRDGGCRKQGSRAAPTLVPCLHVAPDLEGYFSDLVDL